MNTSKLIGKKLMILGGNQETGALVEYANSLGISTHVLDPNPIAPAKKSANYSYNCDVMDINQVVSICRKELIDGILLGVADILIPSYEAICAALNFPCYATTNTINAFSSKLEFVECCKKYVIPTIPNYGYDTKDSFNYRDIEYPVIVKPVDNGAGVGMTVCLNETELNQGIKFALNNSRQKKIIIEKFMLCDDLHAYYTFIDGEVYLSAVGDRYKTKLQNFGSPVCIGATYPSVHLDSFIDVVHPKLRKMFNDLDIQNGVLNIQFFHQNKIFYAYDPGFRLQGEGHHLHLLAANGFDHRGMLITFALTGTMKTENFNLLNDVNLNGNYAATVWILLNSGCIGNIEGLYKLSNLASYRDIIQRFHVGDEVDINMLGTERQVFARIYLQNSSKSKLVSDIKRTNDLIQVKSYNGRSMILDSLWRFGQE